MDYGEKKVNICVFGLWHLGCVISASLSSLGHKVIGLDFDNKNIINLNNGTAPLFEPGLDDLLQSGIKKGNLLFTTDYISALDKSDYLWIAFDTPVDKNDNADIQFVIDRFSSIMNNIKDNTKIIISSQVPVGYTKKIEELLKKKYPNKNCLFAYSPENLRLGKAINVFKNPDRIVIGVKNNEYIPEFSPLFLSITDKLEWMKTESAEMSKHAINSFLATSVVFANEIASICESVGADAKEVARGLKTEERIGPKAYLGPGLSYAGGTLARDINILIKLSDEYNKKSFLLKSVKKSNQNHKNWIKQKCLENFKRIKNIRFGLLGLTYKTNTNTLRRSSAIELAKWIRSNGGIVYSFDPHIKSIPKYLEKIIILKNDIKEVIKNSDCIIISTEHTKFIENFEDLKSDMENKTLIDPTGLLEKKIGNIINLKYMIVGRG